MVLRSVIALSCVLLVGVPPALATRGQPTKKVVDKNKTTKKAGKKKNKTATNGEGLVASRAKPANRPAQRARPRVAATDSAPDATPVAQANPYQQGFVRPRPSRVKTWIAIAAVVGVTFLGFLGFQAFKVGQAADSVRHSQTEMQQLHDQFRNNPWGSMPDFPNGPPSGWQGNAPGGNGSSQPSFEDMQKQLDDMMGRGDQPPSK